MVREDNAILNMNFSLDSIPVSAVAVVLSFHMQIIRGETER